VPHVDGVPWTVWSWAQTCYLGQRWCHSAQWYLAWWSGSWAAYPRPKAVSFPHSSGSAGSAWSHPQGSSARSMTVNESYSWTYCPSCLSYPIECSCYSCFGWIREPKPRLYWTASGFGWILPGLTPPGITGRSVKFAAFKESLEPSCPVASGSGRLLERSRAFFGFFRCYLFAMESDFESISEACSNCHPVLPRFGIGQDSMVDWESC
jgi:hypothetical protein